jgi:hypothetical protein
MEKYRFTFNDLSEQEQKKTNETNLINETESSGLTPIKDQFENLLLEKQLDDELLALYSKQPFLQTDLDKIKEIKDKRKKINDESDKKRYKKFSEDLENYKALFGPEPDHFEKDRLKKQLIFASTNFEFYHNIFSDYNTKNHQTETNINQLNLINPLEINPTEKIYLKNLIEHELSDIESEYLKVADEIIIKDIPLDQSSNQIIGKIINTRAIKIPQTGNNFDKVTLHDIITNPADSTFTYARKKIVEIMGESKDQDFIEPLIQSVISSKFPNDDGVSKYANIINTAEALKKISVPKSAAQLLNIAKNGTPDEQEIALILLYRLEDRAIPIGADGLPYLEKTFDLGSQYNNNNFYGERVTNDGEVGIFNTSQRKLDAYFHVGDLTTDDHISPTIRTIEYDTIFSQTPDPNSPQYHKRLEYLQSFKDKYYDFAQSPMFKTSGVQFNNLTFKEQGWFLIFYTQASPADKTRLHKFIEKFGENGIKTFLSMEDDEKNAEHIFTISQKTTPEIASKIFSTVNQITNTIRKTEAELKNTYFKTDLTIHPTMEIIRRAKQILVSYATKLQQPDLTTSSHDELNEKITKELKTVEIDTIILSALFKNARENNPDADLNDLHDLNIRSQTATQLEPAITAQIFNLAERLYKENPVIQNEVQSDISNAIASGDKSRWFVLSKKDKLIACIRFDQKGFKSVYAGSFMVDPLASGSSIGTAFETATMDTIAKHNELTGVVEMRRDVSQHYINKKNFVITGITPDKASGIHLFNIKRDDRLNQQYLRRKTETEKLPDDLINSLFKSRNFDKLKQYHTFELTIPTDNLFQPSENDMEAIQHLLDKKDEPSYVITHLDHQINNKKNYINLIFEQEINYLESQDYLKSKAA